MNPDLVRLRDDPIPEAVRTFRRSILISLLGFTTAFGVMFAVLNYGRDNYGPMAAEIVMATLALILVPVVRRTRFLLRWSLLYLVLFNSTMMYILTSPLSSPTVFAWVLMIPILSHMMLGRMLGGAMSLIFFAMTFAIYTGRFGMDPEYGSPIALLNMAGVGICTFGFSFVYETARGRSEAALAQQARRDPLTGLGNRLLFSECYEVERSRFDRQEMPFSLIVLDIDHFKAINDRFGHETGDRALIWIADMLRMAGRKTDHVFRIGGEEFCLMLPGADEHAAQSIAETLRAQITARPFLPSLHSDPIAITASFGVVQISEDRQSQARLLDLADQRLYAAKQSGRNRVVGHNVANARPSSSIAGTTSSPGSELGTIGQPQTAQKLHAPPE